MSWWVPYNLSGTSQQLVGQQLNDVQPFYPGGAISTEEQVELDKVVIYVLMMIRKGLIITGWLALALIAFATLSPIQDRPVFADPQFEHFAAFAVLGIAFGVAYPNRTFFVVAIVLGSAIGLEALQLLTPDRHGQVLDAVFKALGGICGIAASQLGPLLLRSLQSRPPDSRT